MKKQKEHTTRCAICFMRCACKWMLAIGIFNLILILISVVVHFLLTGDEKPGVWADYWLVCTLLELALTGFAYTLAWFKDLKEFAREVMRCE